MDCRRPRVGVGVICAAVATASFIGCATQPTAEDDLALTVIHLMPDDDTVRRVYPITIERAWMGKPLASTTNPKPAASRATTNSNASPAAEQPMVDLHIRLTREDVEPPIIDDFVLQVPYWGVTRPGQVDGAVRAHSDPIVLAFDQPGVSMALAGRPLEESAAAAPATPGTDTLYGGQARITLTESFIREAQGFTPVPTLRQMLLLGLRGLSPQDLRAYAELRQQPTPQQTLTLVDAKITPQWIGRLNRAGYTFELPDVQRLGAAGVSADWAASLRGGGYHLSADELIRLHRAKVPADYANAILDAGFDEGTDELIAIHAADVPPDYAQAMRSRRVATDAKTLIAVHKVKLMPEDVDTYEEAGYMLGAPQMIVLQEAGVRSQDALAYKKAGYDFSPTDLLKLQRWKVPPDYTLSLVSSEHSPLTADQVIDLRLRKVSPELVQTLRRTRPAQETAAVSTP